MGAPEERPRDLEGRPKGPLEVLGGGGLRSAELLIIKHSSIMTSIPAVSTAFKIFLTLPVTVASAERSFSKLKLIKNYLRSTMAQDRLSGLSILSIENIRAKNFNLSEIVKQFA